MGRFAKMDGPIRWRFECFAWGLLVVLPVAIDPRVTLLADDRAATDERRQAYEVHALTNPGNEEQGRHLFEHHPVAKCATCHRVNQAGGDVGPDLSSIGGKFDRTHLVESLLEPSRHIVEGYRTTVVALRNGQSLSGIVKRETGQTLDLADVNGKLITLAISEINRRKLSDVSIMPDGLLTGLTVEQFTDLVAYLESLRSGAKVPPGAGISGPIGVPDGFDVEVVAKGLDGATALEVMPDGRILLCEQTGAVRVIENGRLVAEPFVTLPVDSTWERGVIGVTIDPHFERQPYVYICWVARQPYPHHRVSRFTADHNVAVPGSQRLLIKGDDQRTLGGNVPAGHQGGALHFGPDGKLYVAIGEQTAELPAQKLDTFQGKILRMNSDGSIPEDNPFVSQTTGKYRAIWARGCRNPFTFAFRRSTGDMLINDVGGKFEEINRGAAGANYGWPVAEHGPTKNSEFTGPIHSYPQASISGGDFAGEFPRWPAIYRRQYFFADFVHGWIKTIDLDQPKTARDFASGLRRPVDLRFARDGSLYVLLRNAWVIDGKFVDDTGSLIRIFPHTQ